MTKKLGSFNRREWGVKRDKGRKHKVRDRVGEKEHTQHARQIKRRNVWVWHENMIYRAMQEGYGLIMRSMASQ